jgi:hypothetical protein
LKERNATSAISRRNNEAWGRRTVLMLVSSLLDAPGTKTGSMKDYVDHQNLISSETEDFGPTEQVE